MINPSGNTTICSPSSASRSCAICISKRPATAVADPRWPLSRAPGR
jgi:hypothetical protein